MARFNLFVLLCLITLPASAWSGISAFLENAESNWSFTPDEQGSDIVFYGLQIEDRTDSPLRVGVSAGQFELRLLPSQLQVAQRYSGKFISFYLRLPQPLNEQISLHTRLHYQYHQGERSLQASEQISWGETGLQLGLALELGRFSLQPFAYWRSVDGDITTPVQTRLFQQSDSSGYGLKLDYSVEPSAFIRLTATAGARQMTAIHFVRQY